MNSRGWYLQGQLPDNSPWIVPIHKRRFSIGRGADRDLILPAAGISRSHAFLSQRDAELFIEDSGSKNGTFLNGMRVENLSLLRPNDILQIGGYEFSIKYRKKNVIAEQTIVESEKKEKGAFAEKYGLSDREEEVLYLLLRGRKVQEIGEKLYISPGTAKLHTQNIYKKTGCHSRIELVMLYRGPM